MTFLNPLVLFGLIAAAVPVLIHLLQLKKLRQIEFSSIRFLKEIQHASAKRLKLRDFLLLLLRALAIASLVIAFARPALKGIARENSKTSSVIIIDDSPSTAARNEYGEIFSQVKNIASNVLTNFHVGDDVGLVFTSGSEDTSQFFSSINPQSLSPQVSKAEVSNISGTYSSAISVALDWFRTSNYAEKEIYLVGDLQRTEFSGEHLPIENVPPNTRFFFVKTKESSRDNLSVSNAKLLSPIIEVNAPSEVDAIITNDGGSDKSGVVASLYLDNRKVAQSVADIPAGASRTVNLVFSVPSSGFHEGMVQIDDNSIQSDNKFYFSFYAIQKLKVTIVTSYPENDFVISATQAVMDTSTEIDSRVVSPDQFVYSDLSKTDVVVIETYQNSQNFQSKVAQFVETGGGAILFAPDSTLEKNSGFAEIISTMNLGRVLRVFSSSGTSFLNLEKIDAGDNFFSGIFSTKQSAEKIKTELVTKIFNEVQIESNPFAHILMSTAYFPFLLSKEVGSGFAFVVLSPADSLSTNFPMSPFFPVVVQRALFYSAAVKHQPIQMLAGENVDYHYSAGGIENATIISPDGNKTAVVPRYVGGTANFELHGLNQLGTYSLTVSGNPVCEISVNVDPRESNLSQASDAEITSFAKRLGFAERNIFIVDADRNAVASVEKLRRGEDLSSFFAGAALLSLILEIFVSKMKTF
jgi:hypothetical protein